MPDSWTELRKMATDVGWEVDGNEFRVPANGKSAQRVEMRVVKEPLTYRKDRTDISYFKDRVLALNDPNSESAKRLEHHGKEMRVELGEEKVNLPDDMEVRVTPSRKDGQGGYFSPPRWLIDQFATRRRANRVLANLVEWFPLPFGASEVSLPGLTTGTLIEPDVDDSPVAEEQIADERVSSPVASFAGKQDVALQLLEQSPNAGHLDADIFKDLEESFNAVVEEQMFTGAGSPEGGPFEQFTGILNLAATNTITYTDGSPSGPKMFLPLGKAIAAIGKNRDLPPEAWFMTTARWAWIATSEDSGNRPLMLNNYETLVPIGAVAGFPVYLDDAIPTKLGATKNQDTIIACRPKDFMLLESEPKLNVYLDVLSGALMARIIMNRYVAFLVGKYPTGISILSGTGMVTAEGF